MLRCVTGSRLQQVQLQQEHVELEPGTPKTPVEGRHISTGSPLGKNLDLMAITPHKDEVQVYFSCP